MSTPDRRSGPAVLGIDFGTSNTVAALAVPGRPPRVLSVDGAGWLPSAVFLDDDGTLAVGRDAERRARLEPARFEANPKRRIDDGDLMLGSTVIAVVDAIAAVLHRVAGEARRQLANRSPDLVTLTHPAGWGTTRRNVLLAAARKAGLGQRVSLLPEPVAAAVHFASLAESGGTSGRPGQVAGPALAVYDLGGGTFDCAVVRTDNDLYTVASEGGLTDVGGVDFDQALLDQLGRVKSASDPTHWRDLLRPRTAADRRAARAVREDVKNSKEALSRYAQSEVALPEPFSDALLSRQEFEGLIRPMVARTVEVLNATISDAGYRPQQLAGIYLVGGSSRIPLVSKVIAERTGVMPTTLEQPETAVALGAALWPAAQLGRGTGPLSEARSGPNPWPPPGSRTGAPAGPHRGSVGPATAGSGSAAPNRPDAPSRPLGPGGPARPDAGWPGASPAPQPVAALPKKSSRGVLLAGLALLVIAALTVTLIVLNNRDTPVAGPGGGAGSVTDSGVTSPDVSGGVTTSDGVAPDPTRCAVDDVDSQGLTPCLRAFAGGLAAGAQCTQDADDLGISEEETAVFGSFASVWQACLSEDEKYLSVLFQNNNKAGTDLTWQTMFSLIEPDSCGSWLGGGQSRGEYVIGTWQGGEATLVWRDPVLPLLGLFRSPAEVSGISSDEMLEDFDDRTGFALSSQDCVGIVPDRGDCATEPLDDNYMTPCIKTVSGKAADEASLCFPGDKMQSEFTSDDFPLVAAAACSFTRDSFTASAIYLQAGNITDAAGFFEQLAGEGDSEITEWSQGGMSGRTFSQIDRQGNPAIVWTFTDTPVVVYVGGSANGDAAQDEIVQPLQELFTSVLLPQD